MGESMLCWDFAFETCDDRFAVEHDAIFGSRVESKVVVTLLIEIASKDADFVIIMRQSLTSLFDYAYILPSNSTSILK